jgi:hypothetical protein
VLANGMSFFFRVSRYVIVLFLSAGVFGCALEPQKPVSLNVQMPPQEVKPAPPLSQEEILDKYSLMELESAHNLLTIVAKGHVSEAEGESFLGCRLTVDEALNSEGALVALLKKASISYVSMYMEDPLVFARAQGFGSCTTQCRCGLWLQIAQSIDVKTLTKPRLRSSHLRFIKKLKIKSTRQSAEESLVCAENQAWFCDSQLRDYLHSQEQNRSK